MPALPGRLQPPVAKTDSGCSHAGAGGTASDAPRGAFRSCPSWAQSPLSGRSRSVPPTPAHNRTACMQDTAMPAQFARRWMVARATRIQDRRDSRARLLDAGMHRRLCQDPFAALWVVHLHHLDSMPTCAHCARPARSQLSSRCDNTCMHICLANISMSFCSDAHYKKA